MDQLTKNHETILVNTALSPDPETRARLYTALGELRSPLNPQLHKFITDALQFANVTGQPMSSEVAGDWQPLVEAASPISDSHAPLWAVHQINQRLEEDKFAQSLLQGLRILKTGVQSNNGTVRQLQGLQDAAGYVRENLPQLSSSTYDEEYSLADLYKRRKVSKEPSGYHTGFSEIDTLTDGIQVSELWFIGAYTGQGKTFFLLNLAYYWRIYLGLHVVYWSTESPPSALDQRLVARHSRHPRFNLPNGIQTRMMRRGTLLPALENDYLTKILPDWDDSTMPPITFRRAPRRASWSVIESETEDINSQRKVDVMIVDYLSQLRPSRLRNNEREELSELIIEAKQTALTFDRDRGIPLVTAGQTNPTSYVSALQTGRYNIRSIADSAEAERSSDCLIYMLRSPELKAAGEIGSGVLKLREDADDVHFKLREDFTTAYIGNLTVRDGKDSRWEVNL